MKPLVIPLYVILCAIICLGMAFVDQGEFEAMKMPNGRRAPRSDKDQFRVKMTVST